MKISWITFASLLLTLGARPAIANSAADSVIINDFVFDSSGSPWLDGWHFRGLSKTDTTSFTPIVPPGSRASWSLVLYPGWVPQTSSVSKDFTGLTSGVYQLSVWAKVQGGREGGGGAIAIKNLNAPFTYSGRLTIVDTGWRKYTVLDTLSLSSSDTVRIELSGGASEIAFWEDYYNDVSFTKLGTSSSVDMSNDHVTPSVRVFPNPVQQPAKIVVSSLISGYADISIVNLLGVEVGHLYSGPLEAGEHVLTWTTASAVPNGVYTCLVRSNGRIEKTSEVVKR